MTAFLILLVLLAIIFLWYKTVYKPGKYHNRTYSRYANQFDDSDSNFWDFFDSDSSDSDGDGGDSGGGDD